MRELGLHVSEESVHIIFLECFVSLGVVMGSVQGDRASVQVVLLANEGEVVGGLVNLEISSIGCVPVGVNLFVTK